jgi:hypothetical protein
MLSRLANEVILFDPSMKLIRMGALFLAAIYMAGVS